MVTTVDTLDRFDDDFIALSRGLFVQIARLRLGATPEAAASAATEYIEGVRGVFGSQTVYVREGKADQIAERNQAIIGRFDGTAESIKRIAVTFGISESQARRVLRCARRSDDDQEALAS